jgi:hypothetical protein
LALPDVWSPRALLEAAMSALGREDAKLISALFKQMLSTDFDGEIYNAVNSMKRVLARTGLSYHDLGAIIENHGEDGVPEIQQRKYTDADAEAIFLRGIEKGRKEYTGRALSVRFFDDDGEPRWLEIATYCQSDPGKRALKPNEQEFIDEIPVKLRWRSPSGPQGGFLLSIFWKLRGSLK